MTKRRTCKPRQTGKTCQSLTASGWLKPNSWHISHQETADALRMPVERIFKVYSKRHQVIVVYLNQKSQKCCSFFSYRLFARWQAEAIALILSCKDVQTLELLEAIVQYDLEKFDYPMETANAIWATLLDHITRLTVEVRFNTQSPSVIARRDQETRRSGSKGRHSSSKVGEGIVLTSQ